MIVNANLARGAIAMAREKDHRKRLNAIQNFGAMDVLCTDKTGTLTQDQVVLIKHLDVARRARASGCCTTPTSTASSDRPEEPARRGVIDHARRNISHARAGEVTSEDRRNSVRLRAAPHVGRARGECQRAEHLLFAKARSRRCCESAPSRRRRTSHAARRPNCDENCHALRDELNDDGLRVVAVAYKAHPSPPGEPIESRTRADLIVLRFLAFLDPPKETTAEALRLLREHGVTVKILTGDNAIVARKICRDVGLARRTRSSLGAMSSLLTTSSCAELVERTTVFAKLSPAQKARVVRALKANGHTVGFLGDGINDAPALREADVGISVDTRCDIAKEVGRHHPAGEKSAGAGTRASSKGRRDLWQYHQVHQDDGQLELRQRVQRSRGERVSAVPADAGRFIC